MNMPRTRPCLLTGSQSVFLKRFGRPVVVRSSNRYNFIAWGIDHPGGTATVEKRYIAHGAFIHLSSLATSSFHDGPQFLSH